MADQIFELIESEKERQQETLMMIPSENYTYSEVREAVGSILMHKYAEGYPKKRYYQGNKVVDMIEDLVRLRALEVFGLRQAQAWQVNVQPHSGCEANLAVYNALLNPGDKILSMYLPDGGHLSHGWEIVASEGKPGNKVTLVSKIFEVNFYKTSPVTRLLDYDQIEAQAMQFKPKMIISGGTAYAREIDYKRMGEIARKVGAYYLADVSHEAGLIAAGVLSSPFEAADVVTMTTHKTLRGPRGAMIFCKKDLQNRMDLAVMPGLQGGPHLHTIAGIGVALEKTKEPQFKEYAVQTVKNAQVLADELVKGGLDVVSGGTDKHLVLVDLRDHHVSGWFVAWALEYAGIIMNRNTVPQETASPFYPSGLRMGTPAITVRGMKEAEMKAIASWIIEIIGKIGEREVPASAGSQEDAEERKDYLDKFKVEMQNDELINRVRAEVLAFCKRFPVEL